MALELSNSKGTRKKKGVLLSSSTSSSGGGSSLMDIIAANKRKKAEKLNRETVAREAGLEVPDFGDMAKKAGAGTLEVIGNTLGLPQKAIVEALDTKDPLEGVMKLTPPGFLLNMVNEGGGAIRESKEKAKKKGEPAPSALKAFFSDDNDYFNDKNSVSEKILPKISSYDPKKGEFFKGDGAKQFLKPGNKSIGLAVDVIADPINVLGLGVVGKVAKGAAKGVSSSSKAGDVVSTIPAGQVAKKGSKLKLGGKGKSGSDTDWFNKGDFMKHKATKVVKKEVDKAATEGAQQMQAMNPALQQAYRTGEWRNLEKGLQLNMGFGRFKTKVPGTPTIGVGPNSTLGKMGKVGGKIPIIGAAAKGTKDMLGKQFISDYKSPDYRESEVRKAAKAMGEHDTEVATRGLATGLRKDKITPEKAREAGAVELLGRDQLDDIANPALANRAVDEVNPKFARQFEGLAEQEGKLANKQQSVTERGAKIVDDLAEHDMNLMNAKERLAKTTAANKAAQTAFKQGSKTDEAAKARLAKTEQDLDDAIANHAVAEETAARAPFSYDPDDLKTYQTAKATNTKAQDKYDTESGNRNANKSSLDETKSELAAARQAEKDIALKQKKEGYENPAEIKAAQERTSAAMEAVRKSNTAKTTSTEQARAKNAAFKRSEGPLQSAFNKIEPNVNAREARENVGGSMNRASEAEGRLDNLIQEAAETGKPFARRDALQEAVDANLDMLEAPENLQKAVAFARQNDPATKAATQAFPKAAEKAKQAEGNVFPIAEKLDEAEVAARQLANETTAQTSQKSPATLNRIVAGKQNQIKRSQKETNNAIKANDAANGAAEEARKAARRAAYKAKKPGADAATKKAAVTAKQAAKEAREGAARTKANLENKSWEFDNAKIALGDAEREAADAAANMKGAKSPATINRQTAARQKQVDLHQTRTNNAIKARDEAQGAAVKAEEAAKEAPFIVNPVHAKAFKTAKATNTKAQNEYAASVTKLDADKSSLAKAKSERDAAQKAENAIVSSQKKTKGAKDSAEIKAAKGKTSAANKAVESLEGKIKTNNERVRKANVELKQSKGPLATASKKIEANENAIRARDTWRLASDEHASALNEGASVARVDELKGLLDDAEAELNNAIEFAKLKDPKTKKAYEAIPGANAQAARAERNFDAASSAAENAGVAVKGLKETAGEALASKLDATNKLGNIAGKTGGINSKATSDIRKLEDDHGNNLKKADELETSRTNLDAKNKETNTEMAELSKAYKDLDPEQKRLIQKTREITDINRERFLELGIFKKDSNKSYTPLGLFDEAGENISEGIKGSNWDELPWDVKKKYAYGSEDVKGHDITAAVIHNKAYSNRVAFNRLATNHIVEELGVKAEKLVPGASELDPGLLKHKMSELGYRQVENEALSKIVGDNWLPKETAKSLEHSEDLFQSPEAWGTFMSGVDKVNRYFKLGAYSLNPGHFATDFIGNISNLATVDFTAMMAAMVNPKIYAATAKVTRYHMNPSKYAKEAGKKVEIGGMEHTLKEWDDIITSNRVASAGFAQEDVGTFFTPSGTVAKLNRSQEVLSAINRTANYNDNITRVFGFFAIANHHSKGLKGASKFDDEVTQLAMAGEKVRKSTFDYSDLSETERKVFRNVLPFYTFVRKNTVFQARMLAESPGKAMSYMKAKEANNEVKEEDIENGVLPPFLQNDYLKLPGGKVGSKLLGLDNSTNSLFFNPKLPIQDIYKNQEGGFGAPSARDVMAGFSPLLKLPFELNSGTRIGEGDIPVPESKSEYLMKSFGGVLGQHSGRALGAFKPPADATPREQAFAKQRFKAGLYGIGGLSVLPRDMDKVQSAADTGLEDEKSKAFRRYQAEGLMPSTEEIEAMRKARSAEKKRRKGLLKLMGGNSSGKGGGLTL
jgi:hypothetical protein